jgi:signal transduction histidine kinase
MPTPPRQSHVPSALWRAAPVVLTVLLATGQLVGAALLENPANQRLQGWWPAVLMLAQAGLLLARHRRPLAVLVAVAAMDALILQISSEDVGAGTFAVMVAVYAFVRATTGPPRRLIPAGLATVTVLLTAVAVQTSTQVPIEWALPFAIARSVLTYGLAVLIAEIMDGRARLVEALRERAHAAERERERRAAEAVLRERALMARELHDIAAHHLTGIIVSAQAADALRESDPETAGEYIRRVQRDARTTLDNLRHTVGLLRADGDGELAPVASIDRLPDLVREASTSGTEVRLHVSGLPRDLGPLAGIAAYRMVQESLANSLSHVPGAARAVTVEYGDDSVLVTVTNAPSPAVPAERVRRDGYGLLGMAERAELIGATLRTGPSRDGGWRNTLEIPYDAEAS